MGFVEGPPAPKRIWGPPFFKVTNRQNLNENLLCILFRGNDLEDVAYFC